MMKNFGKYLTLGLALCAMSAQADTFESNGLYYKTTSDNTVAVAQKPAADRINNPYKGIYIIPEKVFYGSDNYTVTAIADSAFFQSKATEVQIPNTVTTIGECAFAYDEDLVSITLPLKLSSVSKMMLAGTKVVNVAVPEGVKNIGWGAFQSASQLHTMLLPSTTTKIEAYGYNNCHNLYEIYCAAPTPPNASGWAIFIGLSGIDVIVPSDDAVDAYKKNAVWGNDSTFTLYPDEDLTISMSGELEKYNDSYMRVNLGNNLAYKIYQGEDQIALTAADHYYLPISDHAVTYDIVPTTMMSDADPVSVTVGKTAVKVIEAIDAPRIYGDNGSLFIVGNTHGARVTVWDIYGRCCYDNWSNGDEVIELDSNRFYVVKVGNQVKKVIL